MATGLRGVDGGGGPTVVSVQLVAEGPDIRWAVAVEEEGRVEGQWRSDG